MAVLKSFLLVSFLFLFSGCQLGYLLRSATGQIEILNKRRPLAQALQDPNLKPEEKAKLVLANEAKTFAEEKLGLKKTDNYTTFVKLDRPYVTYVVSAAPKWELKHHLWHFPIIGDAPYKGYFDEDLAKKEDEELKKQDLDTYRRGVSAYSTLGWFRDPILSSMLNYAEHDLVNTIIHETVHATLFIKSSADFNERIATFMGNLGAEAFYLEKEGPQSPTVKKIHEENEDEKMFSKFITAEIVDLEKWYQAAPAKDEDVRRKKLRTIQDKFIAEIQPQMKSAQYKRFPEIELNNARLLIYKTYLGDMGDFYAVFEKQGKSYQKFLKIAKSLEKEEKPEAKIKELASQSAKDL